MSSKRQKGTVKWFNRGYGFIQGDDGKDYFLWWKEITPAENARERKDGTKNHVVYDGETVYFEGEEGPLQNQEEPQSKPQLGWFAKRVTGEEKEGTPVKNPADLRRKGRRGRGRQQTNENKPMQGMYDNDDSDFDDNTSFRPKIHLTEEQKKQKRQAQAESRRARGGGGRRRGKGKGRGRGRGRGGGEANSNGNRRTEL